jgi:hypothetical protein
MQIYARQAKDGAMIEMATDIRLRAERKAGQLLAEMADKGERAARGAPDPTSHEVTLTDLGVSRTQSHRWQKLGALDDGGERGRREGHARQSLATCLPCRSTPPISTTGLVSEFKFASHGNGDRLGPCRWIGASRRCERTI